MIVEMRTYTLNPGTTPEFEKRFAEALPNRTKLSPLAAFWHTEVGPLNQVIHVWPYEDMAAPFSPKLDPAQHGGIYEIRLYTLKPGAVPSQIDRWSTAIGERVKLSPLVFAGHSELGDLNIWCHIWAYKDANHRAEIREKARKEGIWPPKGGQPGTMLKQENMLVVPASFSPLR